MESYFNLTAAAFPTISWPVLLQLQRVAGPSDFISDKMVDFTIYLAQWMVAFYQRRLSNWADIFQDALWFMASNWGSACLIVILATPLITYAITLYQFQSAMLAAQHSHGPPVKVPLTPYWIPFIGSGLTFRRHGPAFCGGLVAKFGYKIPTALRLGPVKMYLINDPDQVHSLFKPSLAVSGQIGQVLGMKLLGATPEVQAIYKADLSGVFLKPNPGTNVPLNQRVRYLHSKASHLFLAGSNGQTLGKIFNSLLRDHLATDPRFTRIPAQQWLPHEDLWLFMQEAVFPVGLDTVFGPMLRKLNPTLEEDFRAFQAGLPSLIDHYPRWLAPAAHKARDRMKLLVGRWHRYVEAHGDRHALSQTDPNWEPVMGSKYIKARQKLLHDMDGMTDDGRNSEDVGMVFAVSVNSVSAAYWACCEVFTRPELLARVRAAASSALDAATGELNAAVLVKSALLQSVFAEVARLRVFGIIPRTAEEDVVVDGKWSIAKGSFIGLPSNIAGANPSVWNASTPEHPHPLDRFWADRFIVYPGDPNSGPLHRAHPMHHARGGPAKPATAEAEAEEDCACTAQASAAAGREAASAPRFSLTGLKGAYIPFGGGATTCPGRQFATQEVIITLAMLVLEYDMDIATSGWPEGPETDRLDAKYFPLGFLPPAHVTPFRIRRRRLSVSTTGDN